MERDRLGQWGNGDNVRPSLTSGMTRLRNPNLNKVSDFWLLSFIKRETKCCNFINERVHKAANRILNNNDYFSRPNGKGLNNL